MALIITDDDFNRANTSAGTVTGPGIFNAPSTGAAYLDAGGLWHISSNTLVTNQGNNLGFFGRRLFRPIAEKELNQTSQLTFTWGSNTASIQLFVRESLDNEHGDGLFAEIGSGSTVLKWHNDGGVATIGTLCSNALVTGTNYIATVSASTAVAGTTVVNFSIALLSDGIAFASGTISESSSGANTHLAGTCAIGVLFNTVATKPIFLHWTTSYTSLSNLNCNASTLPTNSSGNGIVLTGTGTNWLTSAPTFTISGVAGVSITEQHIINDTTACLYLTTGATTGTLTVTDPSQGSPNTCTLTVQASTGTPTMSAGAVGTAVAGQCKISINPAFGGKGPYTYTAYRGRDTSFDNTTGTSVTAPTKDSSTGLLTLTDTPPDAKVYCYRIYATDSAGTPATGHSYAIPCFGGYNPPAAARALPANSINAKIGILGDSIESGYVYTPTLGYLTTPGNLHTVTGTNQAHGGAQATDYDPSGGTYYASALAGIQGISGTLATMMIGTNESSLGVSKATYKTALTNAAAGLASNSILLMLHYPDWQSGGENGHNDFIIQYCDAIDELIAAGACVQGDRNAVPFFAFSPTLFSDSLHPSTLGANAYGRFHADAILAYYAIQLLSVQGAAAIAATGQITAGPTGSKAGASALSGFGSVAAAAQILLSATSSLPGTALLTAGGLVLRGPTAAIVGVSALMANGSVAHLGTATLNGSTAVITAGSVRYVTPVILLPTQAIVVHSGRMTATLKYGGS